MDYLGPIESMEGRESSFTELYKECQRNHAAALGWHATDGCNEYIHNNAYPGMHCEACGCHRNFHNKVLVRAKKIEPYLAANAKQSDNGIKDSGLITENRMNCDHENKKECERMTKEEPLVQKGFEGNRAYQIQGGSLSTPELAYSPFMIFMNEFRKKSPFENNFCGITCAQKWKSMTFAERAPYVAMEEKRITENIKYDELKHKYDDSSSESEEEEEDDEESSEEEDDKESFEEEENDEESSEEDEESDESNSESNDEESDEKQDGKERDEEEEDEDNDESYIESNANDKDDEEGIVFVNLDPDMLKSPTSDTCIIWQGEDGGFELITLDPGCGEQFQAPDLSEMISKRETSAIKRWMMKMQMRQGCPVRTLS